MDILAKAPGRNENNNKKILENESSVGQSYRSSNMFEKESSKGNTSSRMDTASYKQRGVFSRRKGSKGSD
jgi:hypothetical protein